jgi:hypothetical protein
MIETYKDLQSKSQWASKVQADSEGQVEGYSVMVESLEAKWNKFRVAGPEGLPDPKSGNALLSELELVRNSIMKAPDLKGKHKGKDITKVSVSKQINELESLIHTVTRVEDGSILDDTVENFDKYLEMSMTVAERAMREQSKKNREKQAEAIDERINDLLDSLGAQAIEIESDTEAYIREGIKDIKGEGIKSEDLDTALAIARRNLSGQLEDEVVRRLKTRFKERSDREAQIQKNQRNSVAREIRNAPNLATVQNIIDSQPNLDEAKAARSYANLLYDLDRVEDIESVRIADTLRVAVDRGVLTLPDRTQVKINEPSDLIAAIPAMDESGMKIKKAEIDKVLSYMGNDRLNASEVNSTIKELTEGRKAIENFPGLYDMILQRAPKGQPVTEEFRRSEIAQWLAQGEIPGVIDDEMSAYEAYVKGDFEKWRYRIGDDKNKQIEFHIDQLKRRYFDKHGTEPSDDVLSRGIKEIIRR